MFNFPDKGFNHTEKIEEGEEDGKMLKRLIKKRLKLINKTENKSSMYNWDGSIVQHLPSPTRCLL